MLMLLLEWMKMMGVGEWMFPVSPSGRRGSRGLSLWFTGCPLGCGSWGPWDHPGGTSLCRGCMGSTKHFSRPCKQSCLEWWPTLNKCPQNKVQGGVAKGGSPGLATPHKRPTGLSKMRAWASQKQVVLFSPPSILTFYNFIELPWAHS